MAPQFAAGFQLRAQCAEGAGVARKMEPRRIFVLRQDVNDPAERRISVQRRSASTDDFNRFDT